MAPSSLFQYLGIKIENIQKGVDISSKIRRFISVTFNVRSARQLPSKLLQKKNGSNNCCIYCKRDLMRKIHKQNSVYL